MSEADGTQPAGGPGSSRGARPGPPLGNRTSSTGHQPASSAPGAPGAPRSSADEAQDSRAEQVLSQALRVMAGGGKPPPESSRDPGAEPASARRFSTGQLLLLAITIGLLIGISAGFISLL